MQGAVSVVKVVFVSKISCSPVLKHSKQVVPILKNLNCQSTNLVY